MKRMRDLFPGVKKDADRFTPPREFKTPDYPDGGPYVNESLRDYHHRKWDELDAEIKRQAIRTLLYTLTPENIEEWRKEIKKDPEHWGATHHMFAGMSLRNLLRKDIKDIELPTGNWDDYYCAALEAATGTYQ